KREQHGNDKQSTFEQILAGGLNDKIHQLGTVVNRLQLHARGKRLLDFFQLLLEIAGHDMAVFPHEHEAEAKDGLSFPIGRDRAAPNLIANLYVGDIFDADGNPLLRRNHNALDLIEVARAPESLDQEHFAPAPDVSSADVPVVLLHRLDYFVESKAVADEPFGIDANLVLLFVAA